MSALKQATPDTLKKNIISAVHRQRCIILYIKKSLRINNYCATDLILVSVGPIRE